MLIAVIGGAHGCAGALDSALARISDLGIQTVLSTGNFATGGDEGDRVIERLRERRVTCVQGELDRLVVRALRKADSLRKRLPEAEFDAIVRAHASLASGNIEFLRALPQRIALTFEGKSVYLCHGSVSSQSAATRRDDPLDRFRRQREAANSDVIVCGSDDDAFVRTVDTTLFANPGRLEVASDCVSFVVVDTDAGPASGEIVRVER